MVKKYNSERKKNLGVDLSFYVLRMNRDDSLNRHRVSFVTNIPPTIKRMFRFVAIILQQLRTFTNPLFPDQKRYKSKQ